ncbi:transporter EamA [Kozakia baliensis NRIC 0488]|nr:transporter EamA [Kozakia baliensis NRIC 0488]GEL65553.1 hypothetical protein KBA01_28390 [Kozakia baliensis]
MEKRAFASQLFFLHEQHDNISRQIEQDQRILPVVERAVARLRAAAAKHLVNETQFQSQIYTYAQLLSSHAQFLSNFSQVDAQMADILSRLSRYDNLLRHDISEIDQKIAAIDERLTDNARHQKNIVTAMSDGIVTALRVNVGQQVIAGAPLATLLPTGRQLEADLYVTSASIGFLYEGEPVLLRYASYPYQRFGLYRGQVSEITRAPVTLLEKNDEAFASLDEVRKDQHPNHGDVYRLRVVPEQQFVKAYGRLKPLEAGMVVEADIAIDTRPLYQWIFDPVISMRDSISVVSGGLYH